jgi:Ser/Thr protein kinase RdoA (MazF antagonist)
MSYNLQFDMLCAALCLGQLTAPPSPLTGGHLHRMYAVRTDRGRYAVKALNPQVMLRPEALGNIEESERVARIAALHVPAAPALVFDGSAVQVFDGQYYLIFDWLNGAALGSRDIAIAHCARMGSCLAAMHQTDFGDLCIDESAYFKEQAVGWRAYLRLGAESGAAWTELMRENIVRLENWSALLVETARSLPQVTVVSHGDLEPKNVLWFGSQPTIIDWEAAGRIHPAHDLVETALYWSKDDTGYVEEAKFKAFVSAYKAAYGPIDTDWSAVLNKGFSSLLGWLEYSLKRSLMLECCDADEQRMGTAHVINTIHAAGRYAETIPFLFRWLTD